MLSSLGTLAFAKFGLRNHRDGNIRSALILQEGNYNLEVKIHSVNSNLCSSLIRDAIRSDYLVFLYKRLVSKLVTFTSALISNEDGDTRNIEICSVFRYLSEGIVPEAIRFDHPVYIQETLVSEPRLFRYLKCVSTKVCNPMIFSERNF